MYLEDYWCDFNKFLCFEKFVFFSSKKIRCSDTIQQNKNQLISHSNFISKTFKILTNLPFIKSMIFEDILLKFQSNVSRRLRVRFQYFLVFWKAPIFLFKKSICSDSIQQNLIWPWICLVHYKSCIRYSHWLA